MVKNRIYINIILQEVIYELEILVPRIKIAYNSTFWNYDEMLKEFLLLDNFNNFAGMDETGDAKKDPEKLKLEFDANFITRIFRATLKEKFMTQPYGILRKTLQCFHAKEKERAFVSDTRLKKKCIHLENAIGNLNKRLKYAESRCFYTWHAMQKQTLADDGDAYLNVKYFRNWHNSQQEMEVIRYKRQVKKEKQKIKKCKDNSTKEENIDQTIIEFNNQKLEDIRNDAFDTAKKLTIEQEVIRKKILAIKYEIINLRQHSEALTEMMELRQKKMDAYLEYKAEVQQLQKEKLLEQENNVRIKQARKYFLVSDNVSTTSKKQKPQKRRSKRRTA